MIASEIIRRGGIVYGCALNDKLEARHIRVSSLSELQPLQSSKYVQSALEDIIPQLRDDLKTGKIVLFSGTPCQVAGVRKFVSVSRCPEDKFFTVDVLCHGVPSPKLCADWLNILSRRYKSTPIALNFRDKARGWKRLFVRVDFANKKRYFRFSGYDPYLGCFLHNKIQRPICFECPYNTTSRQGDITLGDFWGIGRIMPRWDDDKGISLAVAGSANGKNLIESILPNVEYKEMRLDDALKGNKVMLKHISGREGRDEFYREYVASGAEAAFGKFFKETPLFLRAYYRCARIGLDLYRKICHKGY